MIKKLVRDKIPLLYPKGTYKKLSKKEYAHFLLKKLDEETKEYKKSQSLEELADIMEVLHALAALKRKTPKQLDAIRSRKAKVRGQFRKKILLVK